MISIIVPEYNAQNTIRRCIDSILQQSYGDFEIIIVNDGSKDNTAIIVDEYQDNDKRIHVFHNENHGVSYSRNYALSHIKGEYVMFLDSDDWLEKDAFQLIMDRIYLPEKHGLLCFNHYDDDGIAEAVKHGRGKQCLIACNQDDINNAIQQITPQFIWDKVFSTHLIKKLNLKFDEDMSYGEDTIFLCRYIQHIDELIIIPEYIHHYFRDDSATSLSVKYVPNIELICFTIFEEQDKVKKLYKGFEYTLSEDSYRGKLAWRVVMNNYNPKGKRSAKLRRNNMKNYREKGWFDYIEQEWTDKTPLGKIFVFLCHLHNIWIMDQILFYWKKIKN